MLCYTFCSESAATFPDETLAYNMPRPRYRVCLEDGLKLREGFIKFGANIGERRIAWYHRVAKDVTPLGEAAIGGEDHGAALIASVDELEEQIAAAGDDWQVSDLVDDQQRGPAHEANPLAQLPLPFGLGESADDAGKAGKID